MSMENHHKEGSFRNFKWIELIDSKGEIKKCSKKENSDFLDNWRMV